MAYPPGVLPINRTDATPQATTHPADHNLANGAINDIVAVLGANPQDGWATVTARLDNGFPRLVAGTMSAVTIGLSQEFTIATFAVPAGVGTRYGLVTYSGRVDTANDPIIQLRIKDPGGSLLFEGREYPTITGTQIGLSMAINLGGSAATYSMSIAVTGGAGGSVTTNTNGAQSFATMIVFQN